MLRMNKIHLLLLAALSASSLQAELAVGDDIWPQFRGGVQGIVQTTNIPVQWGAPQSIRWRAPLPHGGQSSPVIWRGRVFTTSVEGPLKETLHVHCHDLSDGRQLWAKSFPSSFTEKDSEYISKAAPTPAVDADALYLLFESGDLLALSHQGDPLWHEKLTVPFGKFEGNHGQGSSLLLAGPRLFVLVDHKGKSFLAAFSKSDGSLAWKTERDTSSAWSTPIAVEHSGIPQIIASASSSIIGYDAADGHQLWSFTEIEGNNVPSPAFHDGALLIGSRAKGQSLRLNLPAAPEARPQLAWHAADASSAFGSPLIFQSRGYIVNDAGILFCYDWDTGQLLWDQRLSASTWASPIATRDRIYFFSSNGVTQVIRPSGDFDLIAQNDLPDKPEGRMYGTALASGTLIFRFFNELIAVSDPSGAAIPAPAPAAP